MLLSVVAAVAVAILVVPTLQDTKVVEDFPQAAAELAVPTNLLPRRPGAVDNRASVAGQDLDRRATRHRSATGTASIFRQPNGTAVVALEAIDIEPGPDYRVIVARGTDVASPGDGLELDALRGNQGTQYYEVPSGTDPGDGWTVLIWCRAFGVPIANASQSAV